MTLFPSFKFNNEIIASQNRKLKLKLKRNKKLRNEHRNESKAEKV